MCIRDSIETESEKSPPRGMVTLQSLLLHSPLGILGTHAHLSLIHISEPTRQAERDRETESEKSPLGGMVTLQSLLLHSPLRILGTHAHVPGVSFKPPGLGHELWSTTWESSDIAITLTAGPTTDFFVVVDF